MGSANLRTQRSRKGAAAAMIVDEHLLGRGYHARGYYDRWTAIFEFRPNRADEGTGADAVHDREDLSRTGCEDR